MERITGKLLRSDGAMIEQIMQDLSPGISLDGFLYDYIGLDHETSERLATETRNTPVAIAETDAAALNLEQIPEHDGNVSRLHGLLLPSPDKLNIRRGLVDVFGRAMIQENPGIIPVSCERAMKSAAAMTAIYELGEFVSRKAYGLLVQKFRSTPVAIPRSSSEAESYFNNVVHDFIARDPEDELTEGIEKMTPSDLAVAEYFRNTRPKRFCATGGWLLVGAVDPRIRTQFYVDALRNHQFDSMKTDYILPPEDVGALYPLEYSEFDMLCSFIRREYDLEDDTVVPLRRVTSTVIEES